MYKQNKNLVIDITADPKNKKKTFIPHLVDFDLRAERRGWRNEARGPSHLFLDERPITKPPTHQTSQLPPSENKWETYGFMQYKGKNSKTEKKSYY